MTKKELLKILEKVSDDAQIYIDKPNIESYGSWEGSVYKTTLAQRKFVHPLMHKTARLPNTETNGSKEAVVIYLETING